MKIYLVKYISDPIKNTIVCNHLTFRNETDLVNFIRNTYGATDIYWRCIADGD